MEAFTLDYKVGWPNSIVLSRRAITKYQLLSRLLYFSKHVERRVLLVVIPILKLLSLKNLSKEKKEQLI